MSSFIRGTIFLMAAVFLSKLLGFVYRIQFMRVAGEETVGIYMTAYPAFIFFLSLVQLGVPVAIAKVIAELKAKGDTVQLRQVMKTATFITILSGAVFIPACVLFTPFLAGTLLGNEATATALYVAIAIVPIAAVGGLIRGYFQGIARIEETAWAQVIEQIFRILLITWMLPYILTPADPMMNAAYAMAVTFLAEVLSVLYLLFKYRQNLRTQPKKREKETRYPMEPILEVALPSSGSRLFGTFTWFLEPIIFLRALSMAGVGTVAATSLYGVISGVLIPLLLFPAFIPYALSVVLVPAVSGAAASSNVKKLQERIHLALRLSALTGAFAATVFYIHGQDLAEKLFHIVEGGRYMTLLAPIFFFYYIQSPLYSILQATGDAKAGMMNSVYGGIAKLAVMFILASQPGLQETGAVLAIGFGVLVTSFLHIATLRQNKSTATGFSMFAMTYITFLMTVIMRPIFIPIGSHHLFVEVAITSAVLLVLLLLTRQIKTQDFVMLRNLVKRY
ncbi:stage V sporulation protein B [Sporosarcina sp. P37]|uniref:putative polysaccharide biosynthesis protein n=1 Tax=unclassified Sporosarcina TaxID=2647733 RepID=UPI0009BE679D|nr:MULTISPECIES: oligosaccharide flippase family protein [unclassified Sporosarcina]ARD47012.1 stage V sporulation protein B [Sporosarcina sp. P33]ARK23535.1 stage V sporulation protein B [Sporosarcina sp. P37]PID18843.1 stage V sporulation protein B [Sporosarcina sp. P35]